MGDREARGESMATTVVIPQAPITVEVIRGGPFRKIPAPVPVEAA